MQHSSDPRAHLGITGAIEHMKGGDPKWSKKPVAVEPAAVKPASPQLTRSTAVRDPPPTLAELFKITQP